MTIRVDFDEEETKRERILQGRAKYILPCFASPTTVRCWSLIKRPYFENDSFTTKLQIVTEQSVVMVSACPVWTPEVFFFFFNGFNLGV